MYLYHSSLVNLETPQCDCIVEWSDWRKSEKDNSIDGLDSRVRSVE